MAAGSRPGKGKEKGTEKTLRQRGPRRTDLLERCLRIKKMFK